MRSAALRVAELRYAPMACRRRRFRITGLLVAMLAIVGCAGRGTLPSDEKTTGRFRSFEEAQDAFLAIEHGRTTADELRALKIDPDAGGGTQVFSYQRARSALFFHRGVTPGLYDPAVDRCLKARQRCQIWRVDQTRTGRLRKGSLLADLLGFRRARDTTRWDFDGAVLVLDGVAVYSIWGGVPVISENVESIRPLSFLQGNVRYRVPRLGERPVIYFEVMGLETELEGRKR